ncbi:MAG: NUDIX domain-containing protein [Patescibacteria group bacterium]|nr:NUDIX domain-containing protein [Patescibacteria group bacterium]MDD5121757.1 NUDIX domain-containing protein [Patescibacteria group bacterium]
MKLKQPKKFPRGIEVLVGGIILNKKREILLVRSPKWANKWGVCGGHIEPGETMSSAIKREIKEEVGLNTKPRCFFNLGEMISPKGFHREAHFIYLDCVLDLVGGKIKLNEELNSYKWVSPKEALKMDLAGASADAVTKYLKFCLKNKGY